MFSFPFIYKYVFKHSSEFKIFINNNEDMKDMLYFGLNILHENNYCIFYIKKENTIIVSYGIVGYYPEGYIEPFQKNISKFKNFKYCLEYIRTKKEYRNTGYRNEILKTILLDCKKLVLRSTASALFFYLKEGAFLTFKNKSLITKNICYVVFLEKKYQSYEELEKWYQEIISEHDYNISDAFHKGIVAESEKELLYAMDNYDQNINPNSYTRKEANDRLYNI